MFLENVKFPLAVRSSSLLEDSQYQPFSGVYDTYMLGNHDPDIEVRLRQLMEAIKRVYASTFSQHAKAYVRATPYRLEEEKMAVLIQQVVGTAHGQRYYPDFSGVVRSRNFYPMEPQTVKDGFAAVALGMGRAVVGGGKCLTFSPRYPRHLVQFSSVEDILANSQTDFWALELTPRVHHEDPADDLREVFVSSEGGGGGRNAAHAGVHLFGGEPCRIRRPEPTGRAHRQLRADLEAWAVSSAANSRTADDHRRRRHGTSGGN